MNLKVNTESRRKEKFELARDASPDDTSVSPTNWFYEKFTWPDEDGSLPFKKILQQQYQVMHETCMEILRILAIGIRIPESSFVHMFEDKPCSTFRMLHYTPWKVEPPKNAMIDGNVVTTSEHMDSVFMALLTPFDLGGLVIMQANGKWAEVIKRPGSLVMKIGVTISCMLGGRFKATRHHVIDIGADRYFVYCS